MKRAKITDKILEHFKRQGFEVPGDPKNWTVHSLRTGYIQKSHGAWSWCLYWIGPLNEIPTVVSYASQWPATQCLKENFYASLSGYHDEDVTLWPHDVE